MCYSGHLYGMKPYQRTKRVKSGMNAACGVLPPTTRSRRATRATCLASQAQYSRAMHTLTNASLVDLNDPKTLKSLEALHPPPAYPACAIPLSHLSPDPHVEEHSVMRSVQHMNPHSAARLYRMSPRLINVLAKSPISPAAGHHWPRHPDATGPPSSAR